MAAQLSIHRARAPDLALDPLSGSMKYCVWSRPPGRARPGRVHPAPTVHYPWSHNLTDHLSEGWVKGEPLGILPGTPSREWYPSAPPGLFPGTRRGTLNALHSLSRHRACVRECTLPGGGLWAGTGRSTGERLLTHNTTGPGEVLRACSSVCFFLGRLLQEIPKLPGAAGMPELAQGLGLDLADALPSDPELAPHLLQGTASAILQPEP